MQKSTFKYLNVFLCFFVLFSNFLFATALQPDAESLKPIVDQIQRVATEGNVHSQAARAPRIVAIGGCPGVGKSTLAHSLQQELSRLGIASLVIGLDHYGISQEARRAFVNELDPRRIQWSLLHETLTDIKSGKVLVTKPVIDQLTKEMGEETLDLRAVDIVLFEGAYSLGDFSPMDFMPYIDFAIYLETPLENIYNWKWEREFKKTVQRSPAAFFQHMMSIVEDFALHVYPTRKNADYIIDIDDSHNYTPRKNATDRSPLEPDFTLLRQSLDY